MRKFGLHLDALVILILLFAGSVGFNLYQRHQYQDLLKEHIDLQFQSLKLGYSKAFMDAKLEKCESNIAE